MELTALALLLSQIAVVILVSRALGLVARWLGQPLVIAEMVAGQEARREQPPEQGVAPALGIGPVERAQHRIGGEDQAGDDEDEGKLDHGWRS